MDRILRAENEKAGSGADMGKPVRVLHVLGGLSLGGAESRIMDLYRCMDREKVQFDFLVHQRMESGRDAVRTPEFYDEEVAALGGKVYFLPKFKIYNYLEYKKAVRDFFRAHPSYAVVQGHMTSTASIYLPQARLAGTRVVCAHARSAGVDQGIKGLATRALRLPLLARADYCFACSREAGTSVFGKSWESSPKACLIPNAIDGEKFRYQEAVRECVRRERKVEDCFVVGHVGRFHYAKNHEFLLEVFACLHGRQKARGKRCVLMLLGEGEGMGKAKAQAQALGISKDVLFLGNQKEVERYYQAFDFFLFPSRFEGLPGTVVEAQAAGLPCLASDRITPEVGLCGLVHFESLGKTAGAWADEIEKYIGMEHERKDMSWRIKEAGFDVRSQAEAMERFYLTGKAEGLKRYR